MSRERGSTSALAAVLAGLVVAIAGVTGWWVHAVGLRHHAGVAADVAALAGAQAVLVGRPPCAEADRVARANHARLAGCVVSAGEVRVQVHVHGTVSPLGRDVPLRVTAAARAGPGPPAAP